MADLSERKLYQGEDDFFRGRPDVGGMIADDGKVIINPYSSLSSQERAAVFRNEKARHLMRSGAIDRPSYGVTDEQAARFSSIQNGGKYGSDQDIKETIAARLLTGDQSAGTPTDEQLQYVRGILERAMRAE